MITFMFKLGRSVNSKKRNTHYKQFLAHTLLGLCQIAHMVRHIAPCQNLITSSAKYKHVPEDTQWYTLLRCQIQCSEHIAARWCDRPKCRIEKAPNRRWRPECEGLGDAG